MFSRLKIPLFVLIVMFFFLSGMVTQKHYGIGNILVMLDSDYVSPDKIEWLHNSHRGNLNIYILAGQSNMEGDGDTNPYLHFKNQHKIYVFDESYKWKPGKEPVRSKFGPSISFASTILEQDSTKAVGIINVARGGTSIQDWSKDFADNSLYQSTVKRAKAASTQGEIKGILFFQGEKDADRDSTGNFRDWNVKFEAFIKDIREDLGIDSLPVVYAQIGKGDHPIWQEVKRSQEKVNAPYTDMIKTDDLDYRDGSIHFNTEGYVEIGKRFGQKLIELSN